MAGKKAPLCCLPSLWLPLAGKLIHCHPACSQTCPRVPFIHFHSPTPLAIWESWGLLLGFSISTFPPFPQSFLNSPLNLSQLSFSHLVLAFGVGGGGLQTSAPFPVYLELK